MYGPRILGFKRLNHAAGATSLTYSPLIIHNSVFQITELSGGLEVWSQKTGVAIKDDTATFDSKFRLNVLPPQSPISQALQYLGILPCHAVSLSQANLNNMYLGSALLRVPRANPQIIIKCLVTMLSKGKFESLTIPSIIIFIPGFKEIVNALQTVIAQWRKTEPFQNGIAHLKLFRCDTLAAGKSVKPFELEYWTSKVAEYMTRHEMLPPNRRRGSFENSTESEVTETQCDPSSSKPRKFVLVGHSLGCWIMRDLIVQHATQSIVMNTVAVYSLDAIKPGQSSERGAYTEYITAISERFNLRIKSKDYDTIEQNLRRVDQQFLTKLQYLQTANSQPNLIDKSREVWLEGPIQRSQAKRTVSAV